MGLSSEQPHTFPSEGQPETSLAFSLEKTEVAEDIECHLRALEKVLERAYGGIWSSSLSANLSAVVIVREPVPLPACQASSG